MSYVFSWMGLVAISLGISLAAFVWAVRSGQFAEQQRLRYLPLRDQPLAPQNGQPARRPLEVWVLLGICGCVGTVFLLAVLLSLKTI